MESTITVPTMDWDEAERKGKAGSKNRRKLEGYLSPEATVK